jgi:hypothetical protein
VARASSVTLTSRDGHGVEVSEGGTGAAAADLPQISSLESFLPNIIPPANAYDDKTLIGELALPVDGPREEVTS